MICLVALLAVMVSCEHSTKTSDFKSEHADSLIFEAGYQKDYDRVLALADSFEQNGSISSMDANRWRGVAYYRQAQYRTSEFYYKKGTYRSSPSLSVTLARIPRQPEAAGLADWRRREDIHFTFIAGSRHPQY